MLRSRWMLPVTAALLLLAWWAMGTLGSREQALVPIEGERSQGNPVETLTSDGVRSVAGSTLEAAARKPAEQAGAPVPNATLRGTVLDAGGQPSSGQELQFSGLEGHAHRAWATTNDEGQYGVEALFPGTYRVSSRSSKARGEESASWIEDLVVREGPNHRDFVLAGSRILQGSVVVRLPPEYGTGPAFMELELRRQSTGQVIGTGYPDDRDHMETVDAEPSQRKDPHYDDLEPDEQERAKLQAALQAREAQKLPRGWFRFSGLAPDIYTLRITVGTVTGENGVTFEKPIPVFVERVVDLIGQDAIFNEEWTQDALFQEWHEKWR